MGRTTLFHTFRTLFRWLLVAVKRLLQRDLFADRIRTTHATRN